MIAMLDLESVRLFVLAVDLGGLTRAAEAAGTVQPVVSQRLKALEDRLGVRLLERSPRFVRPTPDGALFLTEARALLAAHDRAAGFRRRPLTRVTLGISDHVMGGAVDRVLRRLRAALGTDVDLTINMSLSQPLRLAFDAGTLDAALIRGEAGGGEGELLGFDPLGWRGELTAWQPGQPVPLATLGAPCGVRAQAIRALEMAGIEWRESLIAGSCAALMGGIAAGFGIAPMGRFGSAPLPDIGPELGLPTLPSSPILLLGRAGTPELADALRGIAAGMRAALASSP